MLVALVFVLARNIVKLVVERRRGLPFARFRAKLVALLLGMTLVPTIIVLDGRQRADPDQHRPLVQRADGGDPRLGQRDRGRLLPGTADAGQRSRGPHRAAAGRRRPAPVRTSRGSAICWRPRSRRVRVQMVEVYRVAPSVGALPGVEAVVDVAAPALPPGYNGAAADRLAAQALSGSPETRSIETLLSGGRSASCGAPSSAAPTGVPRASSSPPIT